MPSNDSCSFCTRPLDGRSRLFCTACLPPYTNDTKPAYQAQYQILYAAIGRGPASYTACKIPKDHPAYQPAPRPMVERKRCVVCDSTVAAGRWITCSADCQRVRQRELMQRNHEKRKRDDEDYRHRRKLAKYKRRALECRLMAEMYERLASGENVERYDPIGIAERDGWTCSLCGNPIPQGVSHKDPLSLSMDHVVPLSKGGDDTVANIRAAHMGCNAAKGNRVSGNGEQLRLVG